MTPGFAFASRLLLPWPRSGSAAAGTSTASTLGGRSSTPGLGFASAFALAIVTEQIILQALGAPKFLLLFLLAQLLLFLTSEVADEEAKVRLSLSLPLSRTGKEYGNGKRDRHEQYQKDRKLTNNAKSIPSNRRELRPGTLAETLVQVEVVWIIASAGPRWSG